MGQKTTDTENPTQAETQTKYRRIYSHAFGCSSRHLPTGHWPGDDDEVPLDGNCCQGKYRHRSRKTDSKRVKNATWNTGNPENFKRKILEKIYLILLLPRDVGS